MEGCMEAEHREHRLKTVVKILSVIGLVYLFLLSIGLMSAAFKGFGREFAENLIRTTSNPFVSLLIGVMATGLVQSSSTTTSIVVGMVGCGVMTVTNAIPVILGANIGTAVTNTMVALGHVSRREEFKRAVTGATVHDFFNLLCVAVFFPLELAFGWLEKGATWMTSLFAGSSGVTFESPLTMITRPIVKAVEHLLLSLPGLSGKAGYVLLLILSFIIIFVSLLFIVKIMKSLVLQRAEAVFDNLLGRHAILGIIAGTLFTIFVQSSSITTSLLVPMVAAGIINVEASFPIVLGANIGTTTTAIMASFATGNPAAITIAFVHFLFNFTGVVAMAQINTLRAIPIWLAKKLGELSYKNRAIAFVYVAMIYFIVPGLMILLSRLWNN